MSEPIEHMFPKQAPFCRPLGPLSFVADSANRERSLEVVLLDAGLERVVTGVALHAQDQYLRSMGR
jgi:hypothetical protein